VVFFRKDPRKSGAEYVYVEGEVASPGRYGLLTLNERLSAVIARSGSLTPRANPHSMHVIRAGYDDPIPVIVGNVKPLKFEHDWILNQGDRIVVRRDDYVVRVEGAVFDPRPVAYQKSYSWRDYIRYGAGGALDTADIRRTYIRHPNGATYRARESWLTDSRVVSGSVIVVPYKPYKPPKEEKKAGMDDLVKLLGIISTGATTLLTLLIVSERMR